MRLSSPPYRGAVIFLLIFQEAKETLLDPEKRRNYDKWRNCGMAVSYKQWLGFKEHAQQVKKKSD